MYMLKYYKGAGLVFNDVHISATSCRNYNTETIRWKTFEKYFYEALDDLEAYNPELLYFVQPLDRNSYILLEVALGILNRVNSQAGKDLGLNL